MTPPAIVMVTSCALVSGREVLFQQRTGGTHAGKWETPGGKVEEGEHLLVAIVRELYEEIGVLVRPEDLIPIALVAARSGSQPFHMAQYALHAWSGSPAPREGQVLRWGQPRRWRLRELTPGTRLAMPHIRGHVR